MALQVKQVTIEFVGISRDLEIEQRPMQSEHTGRKGIIDSQAPTAEIKARSTLDCFMVAIDIPDYVFCERDAWTK